MKRIKDELEEMEENKENYDLLTPEEKNKLNEMQRDWVGWDEFYAFYDVWNARIRMRNDERLIAQIREEMKDSGAHVVIARQIGKGKNKNKFLIGDDVEPLTKDEVIERHKKMGGYRVFIKNEKSFLELLGERIRQLFMKDKTKRE